MRNLALIQSNGTIVSRWMSEAIRAFFSSPFGRTPKSSSFHPKYPHPGADELLLCGAAAPLMVGLTQMAYRLDFLRVHGALARPGVEGVIPP
jgi:hypothetical protein